MTNKQKYLAYAIGAFLLLAAFYFFLFKGTSNWQERLPVMGYVQPFSFVNQDADTITQDFTKGKTYVANYFFATCMGICPTMNGNMKTVYEQYGAEPGFVMLSHTCQPEVDSVPMLRHYADSVGVKDEKWQFLTGNKLALYRTARESYHIDDPKNNVGDINDQFLHSQFIALVDGEGRLRGVYDGLKKKEVADLKTDIGRLMTEEESGGLGKWLFGASGKR